MRTMMHRPSDNAADTARLVIPPPLAWGLAIVAGLALNWLLPLPLGLAVGWLGAAVIVLGVGLGVWAVVTVTTAGSPVTPHRPTTTVVETGPYRFTRNPIYLGMFLVQIGLAVAVDDLWPLVMLGPFAVVIHYGVVAREEAYLGRRFGDVYQGYCSRVRRWL